MNYIDVFIVVLIVLMVLAGYLRGLLSSLLSLIRFAVSIPLAFYISVNYSEAMYQNYFRSRISDSVAGKLESASFNEYLSSLREKVDFLPDIIKNSVDFSLVENADSSAAAHQIMNHIIDPAAKIFFEIVIFILTIVIIYVITWIVTALIKKAVMKKDSPIQKTDKLLGAVFGLIKAAVAVFALCAAGMYIAERINSDSAFIIQMRESTLVNLFNKFNPILLL